MSHTLPFAFDVEAECLYKADAPKGQTRRIGGIISTESKDQEGETLIQKGLDFSYFLKNGWFNDNHSQKTADVLGYPTLVKKTIHKGKPAHYVEGYLLEDYPPSDQIWQLAQALQKTDRRLGFSIEGRVEERLDTDHRIIPKALVRNVAITRCPVNDQTGLEVLAKSLHAMAQMERDPLLRALIAGADVQPSGGVPGDGGPLRAESVEDDDRDDRKRKRKRLITKSEALRYLNHRYPEASEPQLYALLALTTRR